MAITIGRTRDPFPDSLCRGNELSRNEWVVVSGGRGCGPIVMRSGSLMLLLLVLVDFQWAGMTDLIAFSLPPATSFHFESTYSPLLLSK